MTDIKTASNQPKKASDDAGSMEQFSIDEKIKADQYAKDEAAKTRRFKGIGFAKIVPPGQA
jgi:hypothetical protein